MTERATRISTATLMFAAALLIAASQVDALSAFALPFWSISLACVLVAFVIALRHNLTRNRGTAERPSPPSQPS